MKFSFNGKDKKKKDKVSEIAEIWDDFTDSEPYFDTLGSYTGNPVDSVYPEQDADDL